MLKGKCPWCGVRTYELADGSYCHADVPTITLEKCELLQLRKLRDDLIAVARKAGSGMPILSDAVCARAYALASRESAPQNDEIKHAPSEGAGSKQ